VGTFDGVRVVGDTVCARLVGDIVGVRLVGEPVFPSRVGASVKGLSSLNWRGCSHDLSMGANEGLEVVGDCVSGVDVVGGALGLVEPVGIV